MNQDGNYKGGTAVTIAAAPATPTEPPSGFQLPLDMTEIWKYDRMVEELVTISNLTGPLYMKEFLRAKDAVASYHAKVMFEYEQARDRAGKAKSIAYLEKAPVWLEQHGRKITEEACKRYAEMEPDYLAAREIEAYLKALLTFLWHKLEKFQCAHDDAKKIFDKSNEPLGSRTGAASGPDGQSY